MGGFFSKFLRNADGRDKSADTLASLILAAKEDPAFGQRVRFVLMLPRMQREALVNTAVKDMRLRGEPAAICAAFATLATDEAAQTALRLLNGEKKA